MFGSVAKKVFGSRNQRLVKRLAQSVNAINVLEPELQTLSDDELRARTDQFRARYQAGESLDDLLPEAFATVREGSQRVLGMRHFDVQMIGAMVLHQAKIAEMRTGEGKTLVATLAVYLNALAGEGVHVITVNDYLASRDAEWMGRLYRFLGLSVGVILNGQSPEQKREAYAADITYGTNNEFGFDYLRDNMAFSAEDKVQRKLFFAVIDEVDSILIDEARTPLIISGPADDDTDLYGKINLVVPNLQRQAPGDEDGPGDFSVDEKAKQVQLTEEGHETIERLLQEAGLLPENESLYDAQNMVLLHHLNASLRAHNLFTRDVEYIVRGGEVIIVDEFTGRIMPGRRWSDGLHQAIEAKEGVAIQRENQTLASITFQNLFRLYDRLSGMTGTADTEAFEFEQIYGLEVVVIPTHRDMVRDDMADRVYLTHQEKYKAIVEELKERHAKGQPTLVGTTSIEVSELIAGALAQAKVPHEVLNAKQHDREAEIIAQAGRPGSVTIATNMAGRGTDIVLGGNLEAEIDALGPDADEAAKAAVREQWEKRHAEVVEAGGLHVIGTERHESRRIDNQLRGRSGRQGDVGSTLFYLSLEDSLMRIFASPRLKGLMQKLGMQEGDVIEHPWVTKAIENAQRKVESHNFDMRKHLLEYDDVANDQRKVVYSLRDELLASEDVSERITAMRADVVEAMVGRFIPLGSLPEQWDVAGLEAALEREFNHSEDVQSWLDKATRLETGDVSKHLLAVLNQVYADKEAQAGASVLRHFEKAVTLQVLDTHWKEHLAAMDYLRQGINLRSYAQKNPKQEYKREAFQLFTQMLEQIKIETISVLSRVQVRAEEDVEAIEAERRRQANVALDAHHEEAQSVTATPEPVSAEPPVAARPSEPPTFVRNQPKVGRNEPCPCGSGKKYKQCHGKVG